MLTTEEFNAILPAVPVRIQRSRQHKQVSPNGSQINPVKDTKEQILKVAQDLEKGTIDSNKAQSLLLGLFGVSGSLQPLTVQRVDKMLKDISLETFIACGGNKSEWKEWWSKRNDIHTNSNDR